MRNKIFTIKNIYICIYIYIYIYAKFQISDCFENFTHEPMFLYIIFKKTLPNICII